RPKWSRQFCRAVILPALSSGRTSRWRSASILSRSLGAMSRRSRRCTGMDLSSAGAPSMPEQPKSIAELLIHHKIDCRTLAERSGVDEQKVPAIVLGRWTPSPEDRDAIAAVFGVTRDQIAWGHKTPIQHIYGQGPA